VAGVVWSVAQADDSPPPSPAVRVLPAPAGANRAAESSTSAAYTRTATGGRLKWLPRRPSTQYVAAFQEASADRVAQAIPPTVQEPVPVTPDSPMKDPFGEHKPAVKPGAEAPLAEPLGEPKAGEPKPGPARELPDFPDEKPGVSAAKPLVPETVVPGLPKPAAPGGAPPHAKLPMLEEHLTQGRLDLREKCPSPEEMKRISEITTDISAEKGEFPKECTLGEKEFQPRCWAPITYTWQASGLCHHPLYFEDVHLERYGHSWGPYLQPIISGGHFFLTVPVLPYLMGINPPCECQYTLGYYRPGNCAPYLLDPIPLSARGALAEGGVWTGMAVLIP